MSNWMVDPIAGNANYSGDSWALDLSGSDGQTYGTTQFTTASGGLTGKAGRYIRISTFYRKIISVESDTSCTLSSTVASGSGRSFWIGGAVAAVGDISSTFILAGDEIRFAKTANGEAVSAGSLTWANDSPAVQFASGRVKRVDDCESGWTGAPNVTTTHGATNAVQGTNAANNAIASAFTTGKIAYKTLAGGPIDFSAYQGLSFMFAVRGSATLTAGMGFRICLCSDTVGNVIVDDLTLPWPANLYFGGRNAMVAFKGSGNLGSSIQSVALYVTADPGTTTIDLDDIVAVKTIADPDHLCHRCVLGQGDDFSGDTWWGIKCFTSETELALNGEFYGGTGGVVNPSYRREMVPCTYRNISLTNGTYANPVKLSGGWDTSTGLQTGATIYTPWNESSSTSYFWQISTSSHDLHFYNFMVCLNGAMHAFSTGTGGQDGLKFEKINIAGHMGNHNMAGWYFGSYGTADGSWERWEFTQIRATGMSYYAFYNSQSINDRQCMVGFRWQDIKMLSTRGISAAFAYQWTGVDIEISNGSSGAAMYFEEWSADLEFNRLTLKDNPTYGIETDFLIANLRVYNLVTSGNGTAAIKVVRSDVRLFNASMAEATKFGGIQAGGRVASIKHGGVANTHLITEAEGTIAEESSVRHTASGIAWKISPTGAAGYPMKLKVAELAVAAGTYYVSVWLRRDNAGIAGRLYTPGGQVGGVDDEQSDSLGAAANIWEQQTLTVVPTERGVLECFVEAKGGTTHTLYVDDFAVVAA